jgi:hypothetical protein
MARLSARPLDLLARDIKWAVSSVRTSTGGARTDAQALLTAAAGGLAGAQSDIEHMGGTTDDTTNAVHTAINVTLPRP